MHPKYQFCILSLFKRAFPLVFLWVVIFQGQKLWQIIQFHKTETIALFSIQSKAQFIYKVFSLCVSCEERNFCVRNMLQLFSISSCFCSNKRRKRVKHLFTCQTGQNSSKRKIICYLNHFNNFSKLKEKKRLISV